MRLCLPCARTLLLYVPHTHPPQSAWGVARVRKKKLGGLELRLHRVKQTSVVFSRLEVSSQHYIAEIYVNTYAASFKRVKTNFLFFWVGHPTHLPGYLPPI